MDYRPIFFKAYELVPKNIYEQFGEDAHFLLTDEIKITIDAIKQFLNIQIVINDYNWRGRFQYRGWRPPDCRTGSIRSKHKKGMAIDFVSKHMNAEDIRLKIIEYNRLFPYLRRIEDKVGWVHIDCWHPLETGIHLFNP